MKKQITLAAVLMLTFTAAQADVVAERLAEYKAGASQAFSAQRGAEMWTKEFPGDDGKPRACSTCHTKDLKAGGKHAKTGKAIDPLAPSVNHERLTDAKKIEKWFKRNCKWVLGRECTAQEKGDYLSYIASQ